MVPPLDDSTRAEARLQLRAAAAAKPTPPAPSAPSAPPVDRPPAPPTPLSGRLVAALALLWVVAIIAQEAQANPVAGEPMAAWVMVLSTVHLLAFLATIVGFAFRQRWSLLTSAAAGSMLIVAAIACPLTDHHETVGLGWGMVLASSIVVTGVSVLAHRHTGRA